MAVAETSTETPEDSVGHIMESGGLDSRAISILQMLMSSLSLKPRIAQSSAHGCRIVSQSLVCGLLTINNADSTAAVLP